MEVTDQISEGLMRAVIHNAKIVMKVPDIIMPELKLCGPGAFPIMTDRVWHYRDWADYLQHVGGCSMWPTVPVYPPWGNWARYVYKTGVARFYFTVNVMGVPNIYYAPEQ